MAATDVFARRANLEAGMSPVVSLLIYTPVILLLGLLLKATWTFIYNVFLHPLAHVPGPFPAKLFQGYLFSATMALRRVYKVKDLHEQYGKVVRVRPDEVSISDWQAYHKIFSSRHSSKPDNFYRRATIGGVHNAISSITNKERHAARRKMENTFFSQQAAYNHATFIEDRAEILVKRIIAASKFSPSGRTANIYELDALYTLEVILKCTFNRSYGESSSGDSLILLRAMEASHKARSAMFALPWLSRKHGAYIPGHLGYCFRQFEIWQSMTHELIEMFKKEELEADRSEMKFILTGILSSEDHFLGRQLTASEVHEEIMSMLFGGSGTTSATLTYLIYSLARDAGIQEKLRTELLGCPDSLIELQRLPYLSAVIKETMRLYPTIISSLPRILDTQLVVGEQVLPKGTLVSMSNYIHHRDPGLFRDPNSFVPERWLGENVKDMQMALTPFSVGPHNCLGQNLARAELSIAASKILRKLKLSLNSSMTEDEMVMEDRFAMNPKGRRLLLDVEFL